MNQLTEPNMLKAICVPTFEESICSFKHDSPGYSLTRLRKIVQKRANWNDFRATSYFNNHRLWEGSPLRRIKDVDSLSREKQGNGT